MAGETGEDAASGSTVRDTPDRQQGAEPDAGRPAGRPDGPHGADRGERTPFTQQVGRVIVLVTAALFGVFAVSNLQPVAFDWVFGSSRPTLDAQGEATGGVPLILLLLASFALGAIVGTFGLLWKRR